ncbi:RIP homotypic interaction motif-containing protein [Streptomyces sp. NPDC054866]
MRLLGWILVGLVVIRVGAWVLAGAGHVSQVAVAALADALMDVVVFVAWAVAALAALGLFVALVHGADELHDRRSRKQRAARHVGPVAASPCSVPEEAAPAASPMPATSDTAARPVIEEPVLGWLEYLAETGELLDDRDPGGSDRDDGCDAGPVIETAPVALSYDELELSGPDHDDGPAIETAPVALSYDELELSGPDHDDGPAIETAPLASPDDELELSGPSEDPAAPDPALLILACRGVQIGDENEQFNTYTYELQNPTVDFAEVLGRPAVREALSRLITDPENGELRTKAEEALCAGEWTLRNDEGLLDLGPVGRQSPHSDVTRDLKAMQGFITVRNCQGVQTGSSCYQRNDFIYVCRRATVNTSSLLKAHPEVASSLVEAMVMPSQKGWKEPGEKLNAAVRAALNSPESLEAIPDRSINVSPRSAGVVRDRDGVSIGDRCHTADFKAVMVELRKPRNLPKCVVEESRSLLRRQASGRREPPSPPSAPPAPPGPTRPTRPTRPFGPSAYAPRPIAPDEPRRRFTSAPDLDRLLPPPARSPNRRPEPPSGPKSPSSGRGFGL